VDEVVEAAEDPVEEAAEAVEDAVEAVEAVDHRGEWCQAACSFHKHRG
jgi:hypothetical protein